MADFSPNMPIIKLNANGLNIPIKTQRLKKKKHRDCPSGLKNMTQAYTVSKKLI